MRIRWGISLALLLAAVPAWAALGEPEKSVQQDRERVAGQSKRTVFQQYTVHEITSPDGRVIREYVSNGGMVFAVAWAGPTMPDLSTLLGSYFNAFHQASASTSRHRGPVYVETGQLVVESGGRMGAFRGRAYLNNMIPSNFSKDVIR